MKTILKELGFEQLPMLSKFVEVLLAQHNGCFPTGGVVFVNKIGAYTHFITHPLTKGMFVPTDEEGNVLDLPERINYKDIDGNYDEHHWEVNKFAYQKALSRVLFECDQKELFYGAIVTNGVMIKNKMGGFLAEGKDIETIEQAINSGVKFTLK